MRPHLLPLLVLMGCTDTGLYSPNLDPNLANRLSVSAQLCTDDPGQRAFPVKVAIVVDGSREAEARDPAGYRVDAVAEILGRYQGATGHEFALIRYGRSAEDLTGGFTRDRTLLDQALAKLRAQRGEGQRNMLDGLQATNNAVDEVLLGTSAGEVSRTTFIVVFIGGGPPIPANQAGPLVQRIHELRQHVLDYGAAGLRVHSLLVKGEDAVINANAENVLTDIALAGDGEFIAYDLPQQTSLVPLDLTAGSTLFVKKQIIVFNRNAITTPDGVVPDSDGDGLSDVDEERLGTSPTAWDTDGDGLSDRVEMLHRAGGQDPNVADAPPPCAALPDPLLDSDADGLTDCEERVLGTDASLFDSDVPHADGIPDLLELLCDTNPMHDDGVDDYDFDGETNAEECRVHTDPRGDDGNARWNQAYRYREFEEGVRNVPFTSQPSAITGVTILGASSASTAGVGSLLWNPEQRALTWEDADPDEGPGTPTLISENPAISQHDLHSDTENRWVRVRVENRLLSPHPQRESIIVGSSLRTCFSFTVKNITLVETQEIEEGRGRGWNDIYVYFAQAPDAAPSSPGLFRVALIRARFLAPDLRTPEHPEVVLDDLDFVLYGGP